MVCSNPGNIHDCLPNCDVNNGYFLDTSDGPRACGKCSVNCQTCFGSLENCTTCPPNTFRNLTGTGNATYNCASTCTIRYFADPVTQSCMPCDKACFDCEGTSVNCTACDANKFLDVSTKKCVDQCPSGTRTLQGVEGIRLVGANSTTEGRVEILHEGTWGTICDDAFDIDDAHVICRQLKLGKALEARVRAKYGQGTGKIWIDDLRCLGTERNVRDCMMNSGNVYVIPQVTLIQEIVSNRQSVSQPASQPSIQPSSQSVSQSVSQPASKPASQPVGRSVGQPASHLASQPVRQSVSQSVSQSASQPASKPASQPVGRSVGQPASHLASQPVRQSVSQSVSQSVGQLPSQSVSESVSP